MQVRFPIGVNLEVFTGFSKCVTCMVPSPPFTSTCRHSTSAVPTSVDCARVPAPPRAVSRTSSVS
jgi:hypothetical protein